MGEAIAPAINTNKTVIRERTDRNRVIWLIDHKNKLFFSYSTQQKQPEPKQQKCYSYTLKKTTCLF